MSGGSQTPSAAVVEVVAVAVAVAVIVTLVVTVDVEPALHEQPESIANATVMTDVSATRVSMDKAYATAATWRPRKLRPMTLGHAV